MLRWQKPPTPKFHAFVTDGLREHLVRTHKGWIEDFPSLARIFTEEQAEKILAQLVEAHQSQDVYQLNDYHWLLLWEVLHAYYQEDRPVPYPTFDKWISPDEGYFWDVDFLIPEAVELGPEKRKMMDLSDEAFSIAAGLRPHPDELKLTKCSRCPVCGLALLKQPGEVVPEHGKINRKGDYLICKGVGWEAVG